ncbi:MAG: hypothetical protein ACRCTJ_04285 [Brevinema sp.]
MNIAHKKILVFFMYVVFGWMIVFFIFGNSGIIYNIKQSQQIIDLLEKVWKSRIEIEEMTREYVKLIEMKEPSQAFLIDQGRKTKDLLVFKIKDPLQSTEKNKKVLQLLQEDKKSFIYAGIIAILFLFAGSVGITYSIKRQKSSALGEIDDHI